MSTDSPDHTDTAGPHRSSGPPRSSGHPRSSGPARSSGSSDPPVVRRELLVDAGMAAGVLVAVVAAAVAVRADPRPAAALAGAGATLAFEALAGRYRDRIRGWWRRPGVRLAAFCLSVAAVLVGLLAPDPAPVLSAAAGALLAYLLLVAFVAGGVVPPPGRGRSDRG